MLTPCPGTPKLCPAHVTEISPTEPPAGVPPASELAASVGGPPLPTLQGDSGERASG